MLPSTPARSHGFSLIEMMIALVLGLIVIAGVASVFLAGQQSYRTNAALGDVEDSGRVAFELMARDIRQAGYTGCGNERIANVLNNGPNASATPDWWASWANMVRGYASADSDPAVATGGGVGQRVAGSDSLELLGASTLAARIVDDDPGSATFTLSAPAAGVVSGDPVIACDPDHASLMQATSVNGDSVAHIVGGTPGNCTSRLNFPVVCGAPGGNDYEYSNNATLAAVTAVDWYVGNNPAGGRALYRLALVNQDGVPTPTAQEMVRGVTGLTLGYLLNGSGGFVDAGAVSNWSQVVAVRVTATASSAFLRASVDNQPLSRQITFTVTLRNRVQ